MKYWFQSNIEVGKALSFIKQKSSKTAKNTKGDSRLNEEDISQEVCTNLICTEKFQGRVLFLKSHEKDHYDAEYYRKVNDEYLDLELTEKRRKERIKESIKKGLNNEVVDRVIPQDEVYAHSDDMKRVAITAIKNVGSTMAKKAGGFRPAGKGDATISGGEIKEKDSIQLHFTGYSTTDFTSDDESIVVSSDTAKNGGQYQGNTPISVEAMIDIESSYLGYKQVVEELLAEKKNTLEVEFLSCVFFQSRDGLTYKELANNIGFNCNESQIVKRFSEKVTEELVRLNIKLSVKNMTATEADMFIQGKYTN